MPDPKSHPLQDQFFRKKGQPVKPSPKSGLAEAQQRALGITRGSEPTPQTSPYRQQNSARAGR